MKARFLKTYQRIVLAGLALCVPLEADAAIALFSASSDATSVTYQYQYSGAPKFLRVYLDTDRSDTTGYAVGGIGAEFLIENGNLYKYSGRSGAWGWTSSKIVSMTTTSTSVKFIVTRADLNSPSAIRAQAQTYSPLSNSVVLDQNLSSYRVSLAVQGAPNLPLNGTTTGVSVGFESGSPVKVEMSRDGYAPFAAWPTGTFFTRSADGQSLTGNWCISFSCWQGVSGAHELKVVATYSDGTTAVATVALNVSDTTAPTPVPATSPTPTPLPTATPAPTATPTATPIVSTGPTYYISPSGNDANSGTMSAPWRTIKKAAATLVAGDTAVLMDGSYEESSINITRSGTAAKPITFRAQNKWKAVLRSTSGCNPGFSINGSYITIKDLYLTTSANNVACGTYTSANSHIRAWNTSTPTPSNPTTGSAGFHADGLKIDNNGRAAGVKSNQDFSIIENCESANMIELLGTKESVIRNNLINGQEQGGVSILVKGGERNARVYGNVIRNKARGGYAIYLGGYSCDTCHFDTRTNIEAYNSVAYNNVIINESGGLMYGLVFAGAKDSAFFNNIVIGGSIVMMGGGHNTGPIAPTENPTIKNNILVCNGSASGGISYTGTFNVDYNNFYNCTGAPNQAHPISGSPLLVNQTSDFHLLPQSPAINTGTPVTFRGYGGEVIDVSRDKDGVIRSTPWDLGVYSVAP